MAPSEAPAREDGRLAELRTSARGWHGVQLAVLGFIGLCGVLTQQESSTPRWVQLLAGVLALSALALACLATFLVGRAAWPFYRAQSAVPAAGEADEILATSHSLMWGLILTFVAVALLALSAASGWWPAEEEAGGGAVEVQARGSSFCGRLTEARPGTVAVAAAEQRVVIPVRALTAIRQVDRCE